VAAVSSLGVIRTRAAYLAVFRRPSVKRDAEGGIHLIGALKNRCSSTVSDSSLVKKYHSIPSCTRPSHSLPAALYSGWASSSASMVALLGPWPGRSTPGEGRGRATPSRFAPGRLEKAGAGGRDGWE
jgi:hypothetical protein